MNDDDESIIEVDQRAIPREARAYQGHRAGAITRTLACAVDLAIVVGVVVACYIGWSAFQFILDPSDFVWPEPGFAVLFLIGGVLLILYLGVSWWSSGRSYGNQVLGLRIVNFRGERLLLPTALLRAAICVLFPVGLYWCLVSRANRSLADVMLRTSVIYDWQVRPATPHHPRAPGATEH